MTNSFVGFDSNPLIYKKNKNKNKLLLIVKFAKGIWMYHLPLIKLWFYTNCRNEKLIIESTF